MKRPDLGRGYDGWQALDPTPQEKSTGPFSDLYKANAYGKLMFFFLFLLKIPVSYILVWWAR